MSARPLVPLFARVCAALLLVATAFAQQPQKTSPLAKPMQEVENVRGLKFLHDVKTAAVDRKEIPERLRAEMVKSLPYSLDDYMLILRTLHFVDEKSTAKELVPQLLGLFESQVLAFYDPRTHTYYSINQPAPAMKDLGNAEMMAGVVEVHELTHALQDQHFDIGKYDEALKDDWDASLAYHSVIEGEASLVMMASLLEQMGQKLDAIVQNEAVLEAMSAAAAKQQTIDASVPPYFVKSLVFPYFDGLKFVIAAYKRGGWPAVDKIYANPPRSTREILHPDDYFARVAAKTPAAVPSIAKVEGAKLLTAEHLGEWHWGFLVGEENAHGWVNDRVSIARNDAGATTVLTESLWDDVAHAKLFATAYARFLREHGATPAVSQDGPRVKIAYGADSALIARFRGTPLASEQAAK
ncbi:MAG TPA: hypothetical protein VN605_08730 [Thermoanaerobaculia bacterium]|nr:hypothetical protein [Thermoanaerobaculia bacterium]